MRVKKRNNGEFPDGPVVKTFGFHSRGCGTTACRVWPKKKPHQRTRIGTERGRAGGRERPQRTEHIGKEKGLMRWWEEGDGLSQEPKRAGQGSANRLPPLTPHLHSSDPKG